jgi:RimJ/RimL family protein N-acetyltransferase
MSQLTMLSTTEITSDRLLIRKAHNIDRDELIELFTDHEVRAYLGGPRPRSAVEQHFDAVDAANATSKPGSYVIADNTTNRLIGTMMLDRRPADRPGHITEGGEELELPYILRRTACRRKTRHHRRQLQTAAL